MSDFNKDQRLAWEMILEEFEDNETISKLVPKYKTNQISMERQSDVVWRPQPYIATSEDGVDMTGKFKSITQMAVPSDITIRKSSPWLMTDLELRDALQEKRFGKAARQKINSDINRSIMDLMALQNSIVVARPGAATGFDDIAECDTILSGLGIPEDERKIVVSRGSYNGMASNLAERTLGGSSKSNTAYEKALINSDIAGFEAYKLQYANRLLAANYTADIEGSNQYHIPTATDINGRNVDNRSMELNVNVTAGNMKAGDCFEIPGVFALHHITKTSTGVLKTFRVISAAAGTGIQAITISPAIVNGTHTIIGGSDADATEAEKQYANVSIVPPADADLTPINVADADVNAFWYDDSIELLPGTFEVPDNAGVATMVATTSSGIPLRMTKFVDIDTYKTKFRIDSFWGVVNTQPEQNGILLFNQS